MFLFCIPRVPLRLPWALHWAFSPPRIPLCLPWLCAYCAFVSHTLGLIVIYKCKNPKKNPTLRFGRWDTFFPFGLFAFRNVCHGHAFHFNQPCGAADACLHDDVGRVGEVGVEIALHQIVVGDVAEIDQEIFHVGERGVAVLKEFGDVEEEALRLLFHIADVEHLTVAVDACRTGDEDVAAGGEVDRRGAFEGHTVFARRIEIVKSLEIFHVRTLNAFDREEVDAHDGGRVVGVAADAGRGNIVRVGAQARTEKDFVSGIDDALIVRVDVADVDPSAMAVFLEIHAFGAEHGGVASEGFHRLGVGICFEGFVLGQAYGLEDIFDVSALEDVAVVEHFSRQLRFLREPYEQGDLSSAERRLFDEAAGSCRLQFTKDGVLLHLRPEVDGISQIEPGHDDLVAVQPLFLKEGMKLRFDVGQFGLNASPAARSEDVAYFGCHMYISFVCYR